MLIAGNWKMHLTCTEAQALCKAIAWHEKLPGVRVLVAPSFTLLPVLAPEFPNLAFAAQDCHPHPKGAHTGDVSAAMVKEAGAQWVILGHSERRADHAEPDTLIAAKVIAALAEGLKPMFCVGETLAERESGQAETVVKRQLDAAWQLGVEAVAYEPVWAIGTGRTATAADIAAMHGFIHVQTNGSQAHGAEGKTKVLYGGSVKPENAAEILATEGVDGVLVGGASLKAEDFLAIIGAAGRNSAA